MSGAPSGAGASAHEERQQRQDTRALHRPGERPLLLGGHCGDPARHDLAALGDEPLQQLDVLVVDLRRILGGERTGLAPPEERSSDGDVRRLARAVRPAFAVLAAPSLGTWRPVLHRALQSALVLVGARGLRALLGLFGLLGLVGPLTPPDAFVARPARAFLAGARGLSTLLGLVGPLTPPDAFVARPARALLILARAAWPF